MDKYLKLYKGHEILRNNISLFIEAFVRFYGEENREKITNKFLDCLTVGYQTPLQMRENLLHVLKGKTNEIVKEIVDKSDFDFTLVNLLSNYTYDSSEEFPITKFHNFYSDFKLGEQGRKEKFIEEGYNFFNKKVKSVSKEEYLNIIKSGNIPKDVVGFNERQLSFYLDVNNYEKRYKKGFDEVKFLLKQVDSEITFSNLDKKLKNKRFQDLNQLAGDILFAKNIYNNFKAFFSEDFALMDYMKDQNNYLSIKYYKELVKENIDLVPVDKRENIKEFVDDPKADYLDNFFCEYLFGSIYAVDRDSTFMCFSKAYDKIINDDNDYYGPVLKKERIEYFKLLGLDFGDDYENYINNPEVLKAWPNEDRFNCFIKSRAKIISRYNDDYFNSIPFNIRVNQEIKDKSYIDLVTSFNSDLYDDKGQRTCINPNLIKDDKGFRINGLLLFNLDPSRLDYMDHVITHELNHLYELTFLGFDNDCYYAVSGWDGMRQSLSDKVMKQEGDSSQKRDCELFNEIINELIAQEISDIMNNEMGVYVFDDPKDSNIKGFTSYEKLKPLVIDFYNLFKEDIINSRSDGNIQVIFDAVGEENFYRLNSLIKRYYEKFKNFDYYRQDAIGKEDMDDYRDTYLSIIREKDIILKDMEDYNFNRQAKVKQC